MKKFKKLILILLIIFIIPSFSSCTNDSKSAKGTKIVVGSKDFTEGLILSEIYSLSLEDLGNYEVTRKFNLGSSIIHESIISNEINIYPEYTGTGLLSILKEPLITDPQKVYDTVKEKYKEKFDITWLEYANANDSQGLVILKSVADTYNIKTISDLQKNADKIRFVSQGEFNQRDDGLPALISAYGDFNFKSSKIIDNSLKYVTLENNEADLTVAYTTEGNLVSSDFLVLEDDKKVWPPYNIAPIIRNDLLTDKSDIETILNKVSKHIDTETLIKLNAKVDVEKMEYEEVAKEFYDSIKDDLK